MKLYTIYRATAGGKQVCIEWDVHDEDIGYVISNDACKYITKHIGKLSFGKSIAKWLTRHKLTEAVEEIENIGLPAYIIREQEVST